MPPPKRYTPRCRVCLESLHPDGTCRHDCDPTLACPGQRSHVRVRPRETLLVITRQEKQAARAVVYALDPFYRRDADAGRKRRNHQ